MNEAINIDRMTGIINIDFGEEVFGNNISAAERKLDCDHRGRECEGYGYLTQVKLDGNTGKFLCTWLREYGNTRPVNCDLLV